jgi:S-layer protein (TIGR01567 family)
MKVRTCLGLSLLLLSLILILSICTLAQEPQEAAFVRGHFSAGNGIWRAEDFGWFYYDADKGVGGEQLSIDLVDRVAEKGHIVYSSRVWDSEFEYVPWGSYKTVAFMGKRYLAGYSDSSFTDAVSILGKGALSEVLADTKETYTLTHNRSMPLRKGYSLALGEISKNNDVATLFLYKNQKPVHVAVVSNGGTYAYKIGNIPIILAHLSKVMRGEGSAAFAEVDGVFQVSDAPDIWIPEGSKLGNMEITDLSEDLLQLSNSKALTLTRDSDVPLISGLLDLIVLNRSDLVYYPEGGIFDYGLHEIRGPVYTQDTTLPFRNPFSKANFTKALWSFDNFAGFYFDPEDNLGGELLVVERLSSRSIPPAEQVTINNTRGFLSPGLWYMTPMPSIQFKYRPWGYYNVTALFGELWFAGYGPKTSSEIGNINTMQNYRIIKRIQDSNEILHLNVGGPALTLGEGYKLLLISVNDNKAAVTLWKNGNFIETAVIEANTTYRYKKDFEDAKDLPLLALHIKSVFSDGKNQSVDFDGLFQISDTVVLPVDPGRKFDKLKIFASNSEFIGMINEDDAIDLGRDTSDSIWPEMAPIWPGIYIRTADNDTLRYYLYTLRYVVPRPKLVKDKFGKDINYAGNVSAFRHENFSMIVQAGDIIRVTAEIFDQSGRSVYYRDLTSIGYGYEDLWGYFWQWNASVLRLSDDNSPIIDAQGSSIPGLLYLNSSSSPVPVRIRFDNSGKISSISDSNEIYFISRTDYNLTKTDLSYDAMISNGTIRKQYIKINPGSSLLKFYDNIWGQYSPSKSNHTLVGPIDSLEPHAVRVAADLGRYELDVRIENVINALRINGSFFNVTAPEMRGVSIGSNSTQAGKLTTVKLEVPNSDIEKSVTVSFNPDQITAINASGPCNAKSYVDQKSGKIKVVFPPRCSSTNLTFVGEQNNVTSALQVIKVEGFVPDKVTNGSIAIASNRNTKQSSAPAFIFAIAALCLAALVARRRNY